MFRAYERENARYLALGSKNCNMWITGTNHELSMALSGLWYGVSVCRFVHYVKWFQEQMPYGEDLSARAVAKRFELSVSSLQHFFRRFANQSFINM